MNTEIRTKLRLYREAQMCCGTISLYEEVLKGTKIPEQREVIEQAINEAKAELNEFEKQIKNML